MILSDCEILRRVTDSEHPIVTPFEPSQLQAASYDVKLHRHFRIYEGQRRIGALDPTHKAVDLTTPISADLFSLQPGEFALASTVEKFHFPDDLVGRLEGKSSLGRLGLIVHATAGFFDPGFRGHATLELHNLLRIPIQLRYGMPIAQMSFLLVEGRVGTVYEGKYQDQGAMPADSEYWRNFA